VFSPTNPSLSKSSKYLVSRSLKPLKAEPQEVFGGPNTVLTKVFGKKKPSGKPSVPFFEATVAGFRGKVDGN